MAQLFGRKYSLHAFNPESLKEDSLVEDAEVSANDSWAYVDVNKAINISQLRMAADIKAAKGSVGAGARGKTTIKLYNCNENTLSFLRKDNTVALKAGYGEEEDLPLIFMGQIVKVKTTPKGADRITMLTCSDSNFVSKNVRVTLSFPEGTTTYLEVVSGLLTYLNTKGIPTNLITEAGIIDTQLPSGYTLEGNLVSELAKLCGEIGYKMYFYLGNLVVEPKVNKRVREEIHITAAHIKDRITRADEGSTLSASDEDNKSKIVFKTFIDTSIVESPLNHLRVNGEVSLQKNILIDIPKYEGTYEPISLAYKLDTEGSAWDVIVEAAII